jgi:hypothetical protein
MSGWVLFGLLAAGLVLVGFGYMLGWQDRDRKARLER